MIVNSPLQEIGLIEVHKIKRCIDVINDEESYASELNQVT